MMRASFITLLYKKVFYFIDLWGYTQAVDKKV